MGYCYANAPALLLSEDSQNLLMFFGLIYLVFLLCSRSAIPLTASILGTAAEAFKNHRRLAVVAWAAGVAQVVWAFVCYRAVRNLTPCSSETVFVLATVLGVSYAWGTAVINGLAYSIYSSVFAQWYFQQDVSVCSALRVATTSSFGSLCTGSLA